MQKSAGALRERLAFIAFATAATLCVVAVLLICAFLLINGLPTLLREGPFAFIGNTTWQPATDTYGIFSMVVGSLYVTAGALVLGVPLGLLTAIYLSRFAKARTKRLLQPAVELLAGIPSVVYGFFGLVVIVPLIRQLFKVQGMGILAASIVLGIMILPTIIAVSKAALDAVPSSYYEGALALGASHERCVFSIIVPAALSGVVASVILGVGRAIGETMAVVMVVGNQVRMPVGIFEGVRTMTANIVLEMGYAADLHRQALIATALVLLIFILVINLLFSLLRKKARG
ncbi:MAG: phosphate ABC transporter permease subunit PstC [Coriobacteriales bacterium]|jgi:phosphate transport system permease protein|nr:phosphate ABC transporter permease subunit PstC [Coriobacteriales bacterium]